MNIRFFICMIVVLFFCITAFSQSKGITEIERYISKKKYNEAELLLNTITNEYYNSHKPDSLVKYIFYVGEVAIKKADVSEAVKKVNQYIDKLKKLSPSSSTLRQAFIEAAEFYGSAGENKLAYQADRQAYQYTLLMPVKTPSLLGAVENNLATYAQRMGDLNLSQQHARKALKLLLSDNKPDYELIYIACNGMGSMMWYASKTDSALYFFNQALKALEQTKRTPVNQYYRPAIIYNNLSALYSIDGKTTEAIQAMRSCITNIGDFLADKEPNSKKVTAATFQFEAIDNLAGIYKELGDLRKAQSLLEYSYQQKQQQLSKDDPAIFISKILLGQLYYAMRDFDKSATFLQNGLDEIETSDGDYLFWQADACNTLALLNEAKQNNFRAAYYFEKADSLYEASLQGEYDNIYIEFLNNASTFYASNKKTSTALFKAKKGYEYVVKNQGEKSLAAFYQLLNLSQVYFLSGNYKESLRYSKKSLEVVNANIHSSNNLLDSIKMELKKPKAILWKVKCEYELLPEKNTSNLTALLNQLNEALLLLEKRKSIINNAEDIGLLMADHADLLEFAKKLTYDLYELTSNNKYINSLISLHESGMYNRIRARLDKNDSLQFAHIPLRIQKEEKQLKSSVATAVQEKGSPDEKMQRYFKALEKWDQFKEKIRVNYPQYYKTRYASVFGSISEIQKNIPDNTTLIRYFFIGKNLFALTADKNRKQVYKLNETNLSNEIESLLQYAMDEKTTCAILYQLHQQLWAPLSKSIYTEKVVVIPDGILFNLNFELLTPDKISSFSQLATRSLLAKYTFSYHYSLFLFAQKSNAIKITGGFVAFAPGFTDNLKNKYKAVLKDSMEMDKKYLDLLPQPFTLGLVNKIHKSFGGTIYLNEHSTESLFKEKAGNHQIIHIGTHAESDNDRPEFSRLIFAKNTSAGNEDNSLFAGEIYNCDLTSRLTVLTACESGKAGFKDGEGMISLAHAFNYAGTQSMLTGLWEIDEQASALLLDLFYKNLSKGLSKDAALRQAKLTYLKNAEGRMLAPAYWAGLIIMGDTSPIVLTQHNTLRPLVITGVMLLFAIACFFIQRNSKKNHSS